MSLGAETQIQYNAMSKFNLLSKNPVSDPFQKLDLQSHDYSSFQETIQHLNVPNYDSTVNFTIENSMGDALRNVCVLFELGQLEKTSGTFACYTNTIGYSLIEYIEFSVGENVLFRKYREENEYDFYTDSFRENGSSNVYDESQNRMVGKYSNLLQLQNNSGPLNLVVPINSFVDSATFKSLLLFINNEPLKIKIKLASFNDIINYDGSTPPIQNKLENVKLYCTFYRLTNQLKTKIKSNISLTKPKWRYLTSQYTKVSGGSTINVPFTGDTTSLVLACRTVDRRNNNDFFNYSHLGNNIITKIGIKIDNIQLVGLTSESTIRHYNNYYKLFPNSRYIYTFPFADNIKNWINYSGSLNLRETKHLDISLEFADGIDPKDVEVIIFSKKYNWMLPETNKFSLMFLD